MLQIAEDYSSIIGVELQRYKQIANYYRNNPSRFEPNGAYLTMIKDRLIGTSFLDEEIPKELQIKSDKLLEFFVKIFKQNTKTF